MNENVSEWNFLHFFLLKIKFFSLIKKLFLNWKKELTLFVDKKKIARSAQNLYNIDKNSFEVSLRWLKKGGPKDILPDKHLV